MRDTSWPTTSPHLHLKIHESMTTNEKLSAHKKAAALPLKTVW